MIYRYWWWILTILFFVAFMCGQAWPQHQHAQGHSEYLNWRSQKTDNCCSDRDCGGVNDNEVRNTRTGYEILIAGQWCPVLSTHFLTRGKSPDWSVNHACISQNTELSPCDRLLCFNPKGGF